jgi:hypothetical protein
VFPRLAAPVQMPAKPHNHKALTDNISSPQPYISAIHVSKVKNIFIWYVNFIVFNTLFEKK